MKHKHKDHKHKKDKANGQTFFKPTDGEVNVTQTVNVNVTVNDNDSVADCFKQMFKCCKPSKGK